ncbi:MAG: M64 family metallo-endopeptidase [Acidobacteria bacterium]|nr:M64 family metallo-endopeptidase [Acidobacteriota bacterium]
MKRIACLLVSVVLATTFATAATNDAAAFDATFADRTLRVDLFHVGNGSEEVFTVDRLYDQGQWAGSRTHLVDPSAIGRYRVEVLGADDDQVLFSRDFNSYFGEYRTTSDAKRGTRRTFEETVLVPLPKRPVRIALEIRQQDGSFVRSLVFPVDPADPTIAREAPRGTPTIVRPDPVHEVHEAMDIAVLGEGYAADEAALFRADLEHLKKALFSQQPYQDLADQINVWGVLAPSQDSGCDEPGRGVWKRTALDLTFSSLGSPRYLLTENSRAVRNLAAHVPYDTIVIMVNSSRYGGGGIYNLYCTFTAHNQWTEYLFLHEFGHSFTGLADEYYTSSVAYDDFYPKGVEPPEPNITIHADPEHLKWKDLVTPGTPIPTPWRKAEYDRMDAAYQKRRQELNKEIAQAMRSGAPDEQVQKLKDEAEELSLTSARQVQQFLADSPYAGKVGAFEGAGYVSTGMYRPAVDCIMFSKGRKPYCPVCERAIRARIGFVGE